MMRMLVTVVIALMLAACSGTTPETDSDSGPTPVPEVRPTAITDDSDLARGQTIYNTYCAHCHGWYGEGQIGESRERTEALGYHIVPPHNSTGHTWMHPDALLIQVIKEGVENPLHLYIMAGYADRLTDEEIENTLAYIKLWWTDEQIEHQSRLTAEWEAR